MILRFRERVGKPHAGCGGGAKKAKGNMEKGSNTKKSIQVANTCVTY